MALCEAVARGSSGSWPRVLLFGDSITQASRAVTTVRILWGAFGKLFTPSSFVNFRIPSFNHGKFSFQQGGWGASLADRLVRKCDVLNRGFSGYNTRWANIILPRLLRKGDGSDSPVAVTVFFGANDSALKDENPKQHVPLAEFAANLKSMVQQLRAAGVPAAGLVLITPPPLCEAAWEQECLRQGSKLNRLNAVVGEYARACVQVAQDCGTDALDLWTLMQKDNQDFSSYLSDGLHLSPKGNEFVFSHLWPLIEKKVSSLPLQFPYWRDVAEATPERSLLGEGDQ